MILSLLEATDQKNTNILGSTYNTKCSNVLTHFWMRVLISLLAGVMCQVCVLFVVWDHVWVAPINVVNFVAVVIIFVDTYVGLLPHILVWIYQL